MLTLLHGRQVQVPIPDPIPTTLGLPLLLSSAEYPLGHNNPGNSAHLTFPLLFSYNLSLPQTAETTASWQDLMRDAKIPDDKVRLVPYGEMKRRRR